MKFRTIFPIVAIIALFLAGGFFAAAQAIDTACPEGGACVSVSGANLLAAASCQSTNTCYSDYLEKLYTYLLGLTAIAALGAMVYGGVLYIYSGANPSKAGEAKEWISNALFGLLLVAMSYIILYTINPDLLPGFQLKGKYCTDYKLGC